MSYRERRAIASLISAILFSAFYVVYVLQRFPVGNAYSIDVFHFWGSTIFILIPVSIVINIVTDIVSSIIITIATNEKAPPFSDERDKLIELKSTRNTFYIFTFGFVLSMGSLAIDMPPSVMFIILIFSGTIAGIVGNITQLYFYRRGF